MFDRALNISLLISQIPRNTLQEQPFKYQDFSKKAKIICGSSDKQTEILEISTIRKWDIETLAIVLKDFAYGETCIMENLSKHKQNLLQVCRK